MAINSAFSGFAGGSPTQAAADYCRSNFIRGGGDKVRSGLAVTRFAGLTVRVPAGTGSVGGIDFENTSSVDFTSALETSNNPRIDRLVARKLWPSLQVEFAIVKGAPSTSPVLPALTQVAGHGGVWEFGLAHWQVPGNSSGDIVGGKVWAHGDRQQFGGDAADGSSGTGTGATDLILAADRSAAWAADQFMVTSAALVTFRAGASVSADTATAGSIIAQMNGVSDRVAFKFDRAGTQFVPVTLARVPVAGAGRVLATLQINVEGAPVRTVRTTAVQFEDMT